MKTLALCLLLGFVVSCNAPSGRLELHFIDVGQGDSVLIRSPSGQNVLIDGGRRKDDALEYLRSVGVTSLELVIASHADADHIGGLEEVVRAYEPRFFLDNGVPHDTATYRGLLEAVRGAGSQLVSPTERRIGLGDASLQVIPPPGDESMGNNDNSVGVVISYGDFDAALTGDAEQLEFGWWQDNAADLLREVEVYKAAHHGSPNGDSEASMAAFSPETVVISVGADNDYGHPSETALGLYEEAGATVYRTDESGTVVVTASANGDYNVDYSVGATPSEVALPEPERTTSAFEPADDRDCRDFANQRQAQAFFDSAGRDDPHRLDGDADGVVCTSLP